MTQGDALLRAVLAEPHSDEPRLIYADWCEENGQADRAEFVRVQLELEGYNDGGGRRFCRTVSDYDCSGYAKFRARCRCEVCSLKRREYLSSRRFITWEWSGGVDGGWAPLNRPDNWRRGFVERVACSEEDFLRHAEVIFSKQPVTSVVLTDRTPYVPKQNLAEWSRREREEQGELGAFLAPELFDLLPASDGEDWATTGGVEMANEWLSRACVAYGRRMAGLPALEVPC